MSPLFSQNHLFHRLPESLASLVFEAGEIRTKPPGTAIIHEGERLNRLYVLLSGKVEVFLPQGLSRVTPVKLTELEPGDCFGEYAFVDQQPASASIRTIEDCEYYQIPFAAFQRFLDEHPTAAAVVYRNLLRIFVKRLREANAELDLFALPAEDDYTQS